MLYGPFFGSFNPSGACPPRNGKATLTLAVAKQPWFCQGLQVISPSPSSWYRIQVQPCTHAWACPGCFTVSSNMNKKKSRVPDIAFPSQSGSSTLGSSTIASIVVVVNIIVALTLSLRASVAITCFPSYCQRVPGSVQNADECLKLQPDCIQKQPQDYFPQIQNN